MTRTTVVLPSRLKEAAAETARSRRISFGEFVRRALEKALETESIRGHGPDPLLGDNAVFRGSVPADLSKRHDDYLYGDE